MPATSQVYQVPHRRGHLELSAKGVYILLHIVVTGIELLILRRLANAVREQSWFTVFVELSLIVAGVFLGIQVSNWNEARLDRQFEAQVIERLTDEFRTIESNSLYRLSEFVRNTEELRSLALQLDEISENELCERFTHDQLRLREIIDAPWTCRRAAKPAGRATVRFGIG